MAVDDKPRPPELGCRSMWGGITPHIWTSFAIETLFRGRPYQWCLGCGMRFYLDE